MRIAMLLAVLVTVPAAPVAGVAVPGLLPTGMFQIVPGESSAAFFVPDNRGGFSGKTTRVTGRVIVVARDDLYAAQVEAAIDAGTLETGVGIRDAAMRATYLRTDQYRSIIFTGTASARPGLAVRPFPTDVQGRLTIRDVSRDERFSATVLALAREYRADVTTAIKMADYGIPYPSMFIFRARDPVTVTLHIVARQP